MQTFLAEAYMPRATAAELEVAVKQLTAACAAVSRLRQGVRHLHTLHVPGDELCLHLFEASSSSLVAEATARAGIYNARVVATVAAEGFDRSRRFQ